MARAVEVDTGYYSRKESVVVPLADLPCLKLTDAAGKPLVAVLALAVRPHPFAPGRALPFKDDRVFFLLERPGGKPKLLGPRPKQGIGVDVLGGDPQNFTLSTHGGAFVLYEDESVNVLIPAEEARRLREWLAKAQRTAIARLGARSRFSALTGEGETGHGNAAHTTLVL